MNLYGAGLRLLKKFRKGGPQVYLASREDIFHVQRLLAALPVRKGSTYLGILGGLGTLNFIEALEPRRIILVDINPEQVEYAQCFLELIRISASRQEFAERFFSRKYIAQETAFLGQKADLGLFDRTLDQVRCQAAFQKFFSVIRDAELGADGLQIQGNKLCRRLKLTGPPRGTPLGDNFLYFGQGWLKDEASYARLRSVLAQAELTFVRSSIAEVGVELSGDCLYFHGSNVLESSPQPYRRFLCRIQHQLSGLNRDLIFVHFSTYHMLDIITFKKFSPLGQDAHRDCALKVAAYTRGRDVLELVPGGYCFGRELEARRLEVKKVDQFKKTDVRRRYDVAVSHILYGSGFRSLSLRRFKDMLDDLLSLAEELVVVEHNSESLDFNGRHMLNLGDIAKILSRHHGMEMQVEFAKGLKDNGRNIILGLKVGEKL